MDPEKIETIDENSVVQDQTEDALDAAISEAISGENEQAIVEDVPNQPDPNEPPADDKKAAAPNEPAAPEAPADPANPATPEADIDGDVPQHWPKQYADAFKAAPPEVKDAWKKHSAEFQTSILRAKEQFNEADSFRQSIQNAVPDHVRQHMQAAGIDEATGVRKLIEYYDQGERDPVGYIRTFAETKGIDLAQVAGLQGQQPAPNADQGNPDPQIQQLTSQVQQLQGQLQQVTQSTEQQRNAGVSNAIQSFRSAVDDAGNLKNPHFDAVQNQMAAIIQTDKSIAAMQNMDERLAAAYEAAIYASPEIREILLAERAEKAAEAERKRIAAQRAADAKSLSGSPEPVSQNSNSGDLDSIVSEAIRAS